MLWKAVDGLVCFRELVCTKNGVTWVFWVLDTLFIDYEDSEILTWRQTDPFASRTSATCYRAFSWSDST